MTTTNQTAAPSTATMRVSQLPPGGVAAGRVSSDYHQSFASAQAKEDAKAAFAKSVVRAAYPAGFENPETWASVPMSEALRLISDDVAVHLKGIANFLEKLSSFEDVSTVTEMLEYMAATSRSQSHLLEAAVHAARAEESAK